MNLIDGDCCYVDIFVFIFGNIIVFDILVNVCNYLGKYCIVILEGDLLEVSGVMSGGSCN